MNKVVSFFLIQFVIVVSLSAQAIKMDTLIYHGNTGSHLNIVIMGDGYTATQQAKFLKDADTVSRYLFSISPWKFYANYFNVFAIEVISVDSGARHPNNAADCNAANPLVPVLNPNTYFGCSFDNSNVHRAIVTKKTNNVAIVLATFLPNYDVSIVLSNSPYYGGTGGDIATFTTHSATREIMAHEMGHTFAKLADEYWAGDNFAYEKPNLTQDSDRTTIRWKNWYGSNGIKAYRHGTSGTAATWYKPYNNCKMQFLGSEYCSVCTETIIEQIHETTKPIISFTPSASSPVSANDSIMDFKLTELISPVPNTLKIEWELDGNTISVNTDSVRIVRSTLANGHHDLTVTVEDTTYLVRVDDHAAIHISAIDWSMEKTITGINIKDQQNKITFSVFPNPATSVLNIGVELEKKSPIEIRIYSADGKIVQQVPVETLEAGNHITNLNIENLPAGVYTVTFMIGDVSQSKMFVKE